jgi:tetratricopeptide (TPR) repeat protein
MNKSDAEALLRQGIELYDLGRFQEAIVMFDRGLALYPKLAKAHYFKGIALYDLGKYEDAITRMMRLPDWILLIQIPGTIKQPPSPRWEETKRRLKPVTASSR